VWVAGRLNEWMDGAGAGDLGLPKSQRVVDFVWLCDRS